MCNFTGRERDKRRKKRQTKQSQVYVKYLNEDEKKHSMRNMRAIKISEPCRINIQWNITENYVSMTIATSGYNFN